MVPGYREVRELGTGSGGRVVLATYTGTGAYVAIKYLDAALRDDGRFTARFREEARVMVELDDPNIVRLYEYYEDVLEAAVVMELVDGVPLRGILRDHGAMDPEAALAVFKGALLGLARAHSAGVLHRDLRPENVLVQADGTGRLTDFGMAAPGTAGVPGYTAPERRAGEPAGAAADLYAASCVFFECLTGRRPYRADPLTAPVPLEEVPAPVRGLVAHGMADDPRNRPPTARAFAAELEVAALSAYGPEWERRGRRRLAELATLLALAFPLARTAPGTGPGAAPGSGAPAARDTAGRAGGPRRPRLRARFLAGAGAAAFAVTAALVAAGRPAGPLASDKVFTPPPETPVTGREPAARSGGPGSSGASDAPAPSRDAAGGRGAPSRRASAPAAPSASGLPRPPRLPSTAPSRPEPEASRPPAPPRSDAPGPSPSRSDAPGPSRSPEPGPTSPGDPAPGPSGAQTPPAPPHAVGELAVTGIDPDGATISVRASTTAGVVLTVRFSEGPAEDRQEEAPVRALMLSGSTAYLPVVPHAFTAPPCGRTVLWRVTAETRPQAPGGARSRTVAVTGAPCPEAAGPGSGPPEDLPEDVSEDVPEDAREEAAGDAPEDPAGPSGAP
ncbi:serine/threonine protein kinase-like protein [Planomonospora sphaerica]|uniref:non-specific serine/threonine protein kinase n=1 Tax=Planomonospora sphaerica TaxID=161355 RepID=A0A171CNA9_9ACTN|nr:serine/threonine-protein kinase [Planomonospora sphaerica]GAT66972.1 serine/threonine protein kinase-like protein [Planomonospora sphaerica]